MSGPTMQGFIPNFMRQFGSWGGGDGNSSGDGNNQNENRQNGDGNKGDNSGKNTKQNNNDSPLNIWNDTPNDKGDNNGNDNQGNRQQDNNGNQNRQPNQVDPRKALDEFLDTLDLDAKVSPEVLEKLQNGDLSALPDILRATAKTAVREAILNMGKVMNSRMEEMVERAVEKANTARNTDNLVSYMHSKLKFTEDPDLEPVARSILARAIKANKSRDEAVETVRRYFERTANVFNKISGGGYNKNTNGAPTGNRSFGTFDVVGGERIDWLSVLKGDSGE